MEVTLQGLDAGKRQWNPIFNPWWAFELLLQHFFQILELEYKGICWDQMQKIQDFQKKKG
jgi:hypothetical protein